MLAQPSSVLPSSAIQRRHFLTTLIGASAATALLAQKAALSYKGENIQFGLVTYQWAKDWDLPTLIANCEKAQVLQVELRVEHAHKVGTDLTPEQRKEVRKRFDDSSVDLLGMGTNYEFHAADGEKLKQNLAGAKDFIKLSHDVGGSGVKVKPNALPKEIAKEKTLEQIGKSLAELGDYASGFGQEIRLEVHGGVTDLGDVLTIMKTADRDNVRVCWNSNPADLLGDGLAANFAKVQDYLGRTVHVRDVPQKDYPFDQLASLLVGIDYQGVVCLEGHKVPEGDVVAALAQQREAWATMITAARKATA
jgi:sugar phosphate isomerase/epimerase